MFIILEYCIIFHLEPMIIFFDYDQTVVILWYYMLIYGEEILKMLIYGEEILKIWDYF